MKLKSLLIISLVILFSCRNDDNTPIEDQMGNDDPVGNTGVDLTILRTAGEPPEINQEGPHFSDVPMRFYYIDDRIYRVNNTYYSWFSQTEFQIENAKISEYNNYRIINTDNGDLEFRDYVFSYDSDDRVYQIEFQFMDLDGMIFENEIYLEYSGDTIEMTDQNNTLNFQIVKDSNGRILSITNEQFNWNFEYENSNLIRIERDDNKRISFSFDEMRNPLNDEVFLNIWELETYVLLIDLDDLNDLMELYNIYQNSNNVIGVNRNYQSGDGQSREYLFEYNENNYPSKKIMENSNYELLYVYE